MFGQGVQPIFQKHQSPNTINYNPSLYKQLYNYCSPKPLNIYCRHDKEFNTKKLADKFKTRFHRTKCMNSQGLRLQRQLAKQAKIDDHQILRGRYIFAVVRKEQFFDHTGKKRFRHVHRPIPINRQQTIPEVAHYREYSIQLNDSKNNVNLNQNLKGKSVDLSTKIITETQQHSFKRLRPKSQLPIYKQFNITENLKQRVPQIPETKRKTYLVNLEQQLKMLQEQQKKIMMALRKTSYDVKRSTSSPDLSLSQHENIQVESIIPKETQKLTAVNFKEKYFKQMKKQEEIKEIREEEQDYDYNFHNDNNNKDEELIQFSVDEIDEKNEPVIKVKNKGLIQFSTDEIDEEIQPVINRKSQKIVPVEYIPVPVIKKIKINPQLPIKEDNDGAYHYRKHEYDVHKKCQDSDEKTTQKTDKNLLIQKVNKLIKNTQQQNTQKRPSNLQNKTNIKPQIPLYKLSENAQKILQGYKPYQFKQLNVKDLQKENNSKTNEQKQENKVKYVKNLQNKKKKFNYFKDKIQSKQNRNMV